MAEANRLAAAQGISPERALYNYAQQQGISNAGVDSMMGFDPGSTASWIGQNIPAPQGNTYTGATPVKLAQGGIASLAKGRLLNGLGDGVSDSIPASIDGHQPAALADGEYVIPARLVSELGNGSTKAGAKRLDIMMQRIQQARGKSMGKNKVAIDSAAYKHLPA
jgi:hypothetical protein